MTKRKDSVARHFRSERASRETMAYLLDMSTDTFDRLVKQGLLPAARTCGGIDRWAVDEVFGAWDGIAAGGGIIPATLQMPSATTPKADNDQGDDPWRSKIGEVFGNAKKARQC